MSTRREKLQSIGLAVGLFSAALGIGYSAGFSNGQDHVLNLICEMSGQQLSKSEVTCVNR